MRIAVLGTGAVGKALAAGLHGKGHTVTMGTRDPGAGRLETWLAEHPGIAVSSFGDAAARGELAVLCTNWQGTQSALELAGAANLADKLVIDVTNPLAFSGDGPPELAVSGQDSAGEQVQRWLPESRVVKCWNIVGNPYMVDPVGAGLPEAPTMFIAGDDTEAKRVVQGLLAQCGWDDVVDIGTIEASRYLEALAMVWIRTYFATGSGTHALRLVRG